MSRALKRLHGSGSGGAWVDGDKFKLTPHYVPLRDTLDLLLGAVLQRNVFMGGDEVTGIVAEATGDVSLLHWLPILVDNTSSQLSGFTDSPPSGSAASFVAQVRFMVRVSNGGISVTPKVFYGSSMGSITSVATISGAAACSATASDYSGTNQIQTVAVTLPAGAKYLRAALTVGGTPASGYQVWGRALADVYVAPP